MRSGRELWAEHAVQVRVGERALRVDAVADGEEVVESRIRRAQVGRGAAVHLAPVRSAVHGAGDRLDRIEVRPVFATVVLVHREIGTVAAVGRRQPHVVGGGEAYLHRKCDVEVAAGEPRIDLGEHLGRGFDGDGVLHLPEPDPARGGEDAVAAIDELPGGQGPRGEPVELGDEGRRAGCEALDDLEHAVGEHLVVEEAAQPSHRGARCVGGQPGVALGEYPVGVRKPVELEVVDAEPVALEHGQGVVERPGCFRRMQCERGHTLQGDRGEDADGAEAEPGGLEEFRLGLGGAAHDRAVRKDEGGRARDGGQAPEPGAGAVGAGGHRAGERLHVDVPEVRHRQTVLPQEPVEIPQPGAGPHRDERTRRGGTDLLDAGEPVEGDEHAVGDGDAGEGVAGPDRLDAQPASGCVCDDGDDLLQGFRGLVRVRRRGFGVGPVVPGGDGAVGGHAPIIDLDDRPGQ
ncbi:hypothetical protein RHRU231_950044 [Rhodococcus ruber]|uniref:Uncharacterized protein n=1 Tax=Rhodococcus ruber TaxID=1830 RepID=A0A098BUI5_9NOCA|nr:hypothetical protein RHRU231_950044 [Rhodococcus ruber]